MYLQDKKQKGKLMGDISLLKEWLSHSIYYHSRFCLISLYHSHRYLVEEWYKEATADFSFHYKEITVFCVVDTIMSDTMSMMMTSRNSHLKEKLYRSGMSFPLAASFFSYWSIFCV